MTTSQPWDAARWADPLLAERARDVDDLDDALGLAVSLEPLGVDLGQGSEPLLRALATLGRSSR